MISNHSSSGILAGGDADIFSEAIRLQSLGLSVIPIGSNKKPARKWKPYQTQAADEHQIRDWFDRRDDLGLAIVFGLVSQHVCARDFDSRDAFDEWRYSHPTLARELPIAISRRGGQVYFRSSTVHTTKLADGELRAGGSYSVAPPSLHPTGTRYSWMRPFVDLPPWLDPAEAGLVSVTRSVTSCQRQQETALSNSVSGVPLEAAIAQAIRATLPRQFGDRNDLIFQFARRLKGVPELSSLSAERVLEHAQKWFRSALPCISTKEWRVTRDAFLSAWPRITHPWIDRVLTACLADVDVGHPSEVALRYLGDPVAVRLVGLCERLQSIHGDAPFFLSTDECHRFGLSYRMQLGRRIDRLRDDKVLERLTIGKKSARLASTFRYLPTISLVHKMNLDSASIEVEHQSIRL